MTHEQAHSQSNLSNPKSGATIPPISTSTVPSNTNPSATTKATTIGNVKASTQPSSQKMSSPLPRETSPSQPSNSVMVRVSPSLPSTGSQPQSQLQPPSSKRPRVSAPVSTKSRISAAPVPAPVPPPVPPHPDSVSREVFLLTGGVTPAPLVPTISTRTAAKPRRKIAWRWRQFKNSSRKDGLMLSHWIKGADGANNSDYAFTRFNKPIRLLEYTEQEYEQIIKDLVPLCDLPKKEVEKEKEKEKDQGTKAGSLRHGIHQVPPQAPWTKEETDTLFQLCKDYDLRFPVIHDRWPDSLSKRSVDELKDRYYSVAKKLIEHRVRQNSEFPASLPLALQKHCQAITMNPFDYEYECIRKNQLQWQYTRSKEELREEEETVREARRIEANRKRLAKERQRLAKLLTPAGDVPMSADGKKDLDHVIAAAAVSMPHKPFPHRKVTTGAYARSSLIYAPVSQSARISKRIDAALIELRVGTRPMPTSIVVDNFDLLRMDILSYIELHRTVQKKEEDTHMLRVKLAKLKGEAPPPPPPGVTITHKKRRADDGEIAPLFGGVVVKQT